MSMFGKFGKAKKTEEEGDSDNKKASIRGDDTANGNQSSQNSNLGIDYSQ